MANIPIFSKDIGNLTGADATGEPIYVKRKIAFGIDGESFDVSSINPLPVTGTFTPGGAGFSSFGQSTPKVVTVTDVSTPLLVENPLRKFAWIINNSTSRVYIQYGIDAVYGRGCPLGQNARMFITTDELYLGAVNAIAITGASVDIDVLEGI